MPKEGFKGDPVKLRAKRQRQNLRTFHNIQARRAKHDKAHRMEPGTTNASATNFKTEPVAKS